jgi:hypothetical protein
LSKPFSVSVLGLDHLGEPLWTLTQGPDHLTAELCRHRNAGWEIQVAHDGVFRYAERYPTRARALMEADACRRQLVANGWITATQISLDVVEGGHHAKHGGGPSATTIRRDPSTLRLGPP